VTPRCRRDLPPYVTFKTGAELLIAEGIVSSITSDGIRYIARKQPEGWPFGEGRRHAYGMVGNARVMETGPFLAYFRKHPPRGRGPAKKSRTDGGAS
jgi:hypothetical protein